MERSDVIQNECVSDIETSAIEDVAVEDLVSSETAATSVLSDTIETKTEDLEALGGNILAVETVNTEQKSEEKEALNEIICKTLEKVKQYFFNNEIEESKLAEFVFKILTFNVEDINLEDFQISPDFLDQTVDLIMNDRRVITEQDKFNDIIDNLFGPEAAKAISDKLCTEKIDEVVENLFGKDTKTLICEKLDSESLDELFNKLIDEKLQQDDNPEANHPMYDHFIEKVLGKETEEFIRRKLETLLNQNTGCESIKVSDLSLVD